jgi:hypothetical protein
MMTPPTAHASAILSSIAAFQSIEAPAQSNVGLRNGKDSFSLHVMVKSWCSDFSLLEIF